MRLLYGLWAADLPRSSLGRVAERAAATGDDLAVAVVSRGEGPPDEDLVDRARETLTTAGLEPDVRVLSGDPASRLVDLAEREGFDRIVLGGGKRSPMGKIEMDPVVQAVLMSSSVTVTVVRQP